MNLTPIFNQYLRHAHIPRLELLFGEAPGMVMYKWDADEDGFAMPVKVGRRIIGRSFIRRRSGRVCRRR